MLSHPLNINNIYTFMTQIYNIKDELSIIKTKNHLKKSTLKNLPNFMEIYKV